MLSFFRNIKSVQPVLKTVLCENKVQSFSGSKVRHNNGSFWETFSEREHINCALPYAKPDTSEIAYYKALGLMELGKEFSGDSIASFKKAIELDSKNRYTRDAEEKIAIIRSRFTKN